MGNRGVVDRLRVAVGFAVFLAVCVAAPVLAAESPNTFPQVSSIKGTGVGVGSAQVASSPSGTDGSDSTQADGSAESKSPPADGMFAGEVDSANQEAALRDGWLESPNAIAEREASRTAYDDMTAIESESVLGSAFQDELKEIDGDPARLLSDLEIEEVVGEHAVLAVGPDGGRELVELSIPVRSQIAGENAGDPVDLSLKLSGESFAPKSPALAQVTLPSTLGGRIAVGEELGFTALPGNPEVAARPMATRICSSRTRAPTRTRWLRHSRVASRS